MVASVVTVPKTQKAQVTREFGLNPKFEEIPVPEPKDDELLVHVIYSGVCHTDVGVVKNEYRALGLSLPIIAGHEGAGIVVKIGKSVTGFKEGDRVGCAYLHRTCNTCEHCKQQGNEAFCYSAEYLANHRNWGTFQQYVAVQAFQAHLIPEKLDMAKAAPILCAGVTVYRSLKETGARPGQFVSITGAGGGLGSLALQYAKALGFRPIAIDFGDTKREYCLKQGAEFFVDAKNQDVVQEVRRVTDGKGPHAVVNIAPAIKPIEDAIKHVPSQRKNRFGYFAINSVNKCQDGRLCQMYKFIY
uniref:alcohol dehydrogenase n=1 Tax=Acrobeloides nanus TaxID=290746 RepID=A0A914EBZ3_9BILA